MNLKKVALLTAGSALLTVIAAVRPPSVRAASFDTISRIYVYGDSYSEDGTAFELSQQAVEAGVPDAFILPAEPDLNLYDEQGRWTNGPTAVEVLAKTLDVELTNYAVGGAKSGDGNYYGWLDSVQNTGAFGQVEQFSREASNQNADENALHFIFISANDLFEYVDFGLSGSVEELATRTVGNIGQSITDLTSLGAQQFMVVNSSDLGIVPGVIEFGQAQEAELFTQVVNDLLPSTLDLVSQQTDTDIALYDHVAISNEIRSNPQEYGLTNLTDPCQPVFPVEPRCANPDQYYFWDEYHPTERVHEIIGLDMAKFVAAQTSQTVPEPAVGAFLTLGLLAIANRRSAHSKD